MKIVLEDKVLAHLDGISNSMLISLLWSLCYYDFKEYEEILEEVAGAMESRG